MEKSNVLYLMIGNNPMPNFIAIATRLEVGGQVICFYTDETKCKYDKLRSIVGKKGCNVNIMGIPIQDENDVFKVRKDMDGKIQIDDSKFYELNYTGGNKVMAAVGYNIFRNKVKNVNGHGILSYFDSENEVVDYVVINGDKLQFENVKYSKLVDNIKITAEDIMELHNETDIIDKDIDDEFNKLSNTIAKEVIENWNEALKFLTCFDRLNKKKLDEKYLRKSLNKCKLKYLPDIKSVIGEKNEGNMNEDEYEKYRIILKGFWMENYIRSILYELKEEGVIAEVLSSVTRKDEHNSDSFEVDFIIYANFSLRTLSVTEMTDGDDVMGKLYEVRSRAYQLCGDVNKVAFINLSSSNDEMAAQYKKIYQCEANNEILLISRDRFSQCKDLIRSWVVGGEEK